MDCAEPSDLAPPPEQRRATGAWPLQKVRAARLERRVAPVRAPRVAGDGLLREEARGGDHREAAVRELLLLHLAELGGVLGREVERVEAELARHVAVAQRLRGRLRLGVELLEALGDARLLGGTDAREHSAPQPDRQLRDLVDG